MNFNDMAKYLINKGYDLYVSEWHPIIKYGIQHDWCRLVKYPCELISPRSWGNIIAIDSKLNHRNLDREIKSIIDSYIKKQKSIKPNLKKYAGTLKAKLHRLETKTRHKSSTYYIKIAEYLLANYNDLYRVLRFFIRSLRFMKERYSKFYPFLIVLSTVLIISFIFGGSYRFIFSGIGISALLITFLMSVSTYGASILYKGKTNRDNEINNLKNIIDANSTLLKETMVDQQQKSNAYEEKIISLTATNEKLTKSLEQKEKSINNTITSLKNELVYYTKGTHQFFNRYVDQNFVNNLLDKMNGNLIDTNINQNIVNYSCTYINSIENRCKGRFAGNIEDIILRNLYISNIKKDKINLLEIGSLFGIQLAIIYNLCRGHFKRIQLSAIDPLDGYYGKKNLDILTNEPIDEMIFYHNMRVTDVAQDDIRLIKMMSTDEKAMKEAGERKYDVLIIDGDHSFDGVKFDFVNYVHFVEKKGLIIFDDYNSKEWPGVTRYIEENVKISKDVEFIYSDYRTAIFKKN
jgi:hypothetical protein